MVIACGRSCLLANISTTASRSSSSCNCFRFNNKIILLVPAKRSQNHRPSYHVLQLFLRFADALAVVRVDDKDQTLRVLEVVAPQRPNLVLAADIPYGEADVLVLDRFDVEADRRYGGDDFAQLQLVEDRRLAGRVQADCMANTMEKVVINIEVRAYGRNLKYE